MAFAWDFNAVLWDDTKGRCSEAVSAWLKGERRKVLAAMREKSQRNQNCTESILAMLVIMVGHGRGPPEGNVVGVAQRYGLQPLVIRFYATRPHHLSAGMHRIVVRAECPSENCFI